MGLLMGGLAGWQSDGQIDRFSQRMAGRAGGRVAGIWADRRRDVRAGESLAGSTGRNLGLLMDGRAISDGRNGPV